MPVNVKEVLSKKSETVITTTADQSLVGASQLLVKHNIGALVVADSGGNPIGILSERDIVRKLAAAKADVVTLHVADAMTEDVLIALPEDDLSYISNVMTDRRVRHLPIMDEHKLVGIISIGDVVKAQLDYFESEAHMLRQYITGG